MNEMHEKRGFIIGAIVTLLVSGLLVSHLEFTIIQSMIISHVTLGGLAFLAGGLALFAKKGGRLHRRAGLTFYISMVLSVVLTLVVAVLPHHVSPTLFQIGVLSLYFLLGGKRSIKFKRAPLNLKLDHALAFVVIILSGIVILYSIVLDGYIHPLRTVFGLVGIGFGAVDLYLFQRPQLVARQWLVLHLSKMIGGYTAAVTAFLVAQKIFGGYFDWFVPTALGLTYIGYWVVKLTFKRGPAGTEKKAVNA